MTKLTYANVKIIIDKEDKLISTEYVNNKSLLDIICSKCNLIYKQTYDRYKRGNRHKDCKNKIIKKYKHKNKKEIKKECLWCKVEFIIKRKKQEYCSRECVNKKLNSNIELRKEWGRIGGNKSLKILNRRSKGEIHFANLCIDQFGNDNIVCNELLFKDKNNNYWDADIIITHLKIAVLYNGIFHYKKVYKDQKLDRMIIKDKLKQKIIIDNGYTFYIIKDLKSYNKQFVIDQFNLFIHKLSFNFVLDLFNKIVI